MKITSDLKHLLFRLAIFLTLFILVTGIIGPWVISTRLLYEFHFFIYGNLGKLVILSVIIFFFLTRDRIKELRIKNYELRNLLFLLVSIFLVFTFFPLARELLTYPGFDSNIPLSLLTHLNLVLIPVFIAFGIFGWGFLRDFTIKFQRELLICTGLSAVLFAAIFQVWKLWPFFSQFVLQVQYFLYSHIYENVFIIAPMTLFVHSFAVEIGEACSGLESIFLFTVLYIIISFIDRKTLDFKKVILFYPLLLAGLVLVNIIRVFTLILIGLTISPQVMAALFHTYLGMVLFIIYFLLFLKFIYKKLKK